MYVTLQYSTCDSKLKQKAKSLAVQCEMAYANLAAAAAPRVALPCYGKWLLGIHYPATRAQTCGALASAAVAVARPRREATPPLFRGLVSVEQSSR